MKKVVHGSARKQVTLRKNGQVQIELAIKEVPKIKLWQVPAETNHLTEEVETTLQTDTLLIRTVLPFDFTQTIAIFWEG